MITLALDASTYRGTVAVFQHSRLLAEGEAAMRGRDTELLMPAVETALRNANLSVRDLGRVVCGGGPGSFTSLRIASSLAKGIAVGRGIPLYAVSSLALIVAGNVHGEGAGQRYMAVLDALRAASYVAEFEHIGSAIQAAGTSRLLPTADVPEVARLAGARPAGAEQPGGWLPHARGLVLLLDGVIGQGPVDLAGWEPLYGRMAEAQAKWEAAHGRPLRA